MKPGDHVITYNKPTKHIIDGTHLHDALSMKYGNDKDLSDKWFREIDIPVEAEGLYAVHYNSRHGLQLSIDDMKAMLKKYLDENYKLKYGTLKEIARLWNRPYKTIEMWVAEIHHPESSFHGKSLPVGISTGNGGSEDREVELRQLRNLQAIVVDKLKCEPEQIPRKLEDLVEKEYKWDNISQTKKVSCPKCKTKFEVSIL